MNTLVMGASGHVGSALMRALAQGGIEAVGASHTRRAPGMLTLDIRDAHAVHACITSMKPEVIFVAVNTAGGVDYCETHPDEAKALNVDGTRHIAEAAAQQRARVIYYSTDYVFDGTAGPYDETAAPSPVNVYGRTKWEAEQILRQLAPNACILRTTAVVGWDRQSKNFAMQVWETLERGEPIRVPSDQWCNPTLADYLAEVSVRLAQQGAEGVFNVVGKDRMTRADLAKQLARTMALDQSLIHPVTTEELGQKARRPLQGGLRTEKLEQTLGTEPLNLQESLKRFRRQWWGDTRVTYERKPTSDAAGQLKQDIFKRVEQYYDVVHKHRSFTPFKTRIGYAGRVFGSEEMVNLVDSALDFWLTMGAYGELFEQKMRRFFGAQDFLLVNSGSSANLTAVLTLMSQQLDRPLQPGDEVITPAATFPTTLAPIVHGGMVPVFVDCEIGTYNINPNLLADAISPKTRAIMVPHTLGNPCDLDALCDLAKRHQCYLVEDCCDALGSTFRDRLVGTFGDVATLSFFPAHHITMGEGGGVIVNRARLARIVRSVRDWGRDCWCAPGESNTCGRRFGWQLGDLPKGYDHKFTYSNLGYNFKATDMQAAVGVAQCERLPAFIEQRRRNFQRLYEGLTSYEEHCILPHHLPQANPSWFAFPITVTNGLSRFALVQHLERANIETREIFAGNILRQPAYRNIRARVVGALDQTDRVMRDTFFIGVYPGLTEEMIAFILEQFRTFFANWQSPHVIPVGAAGVARS